MARIYHPNAVPYFPEHNDGVLETLGKSFVRGFLNIGAGAVGTAEWLAEQTPWTEEGGFLEQMRVNIREEEKEWETDPDSKLEWVAGVVGMALPYMGAAMTGQAAIGLPGAAAVGFAVEGQEAYESAKARGASEGQANWERGIVGSVNAAIESLQMGRLFKFSKSGTKSFKAFRKLASQKAWDKVYKEGFKFSRELLLNSIEEAGEEFLQEGVSLTVPYFMEDLGPQDPAGLFNYLMENKEQLGAAVLGGAVVAPLLGVTRAAIPSLAGPSVESFNKLKQRVNESTLLKATKEARIRDINKKMEQIFGEVPEIVDEAATVEEGKRSPDTQNKHASLIDRMEENLTVWEETRGEHEEIIKRKLGEKFGEVENFNKEVLNDDTLPIEAKVASIMSFMKGRMAPGYTRFLDSGFTKEEFNELRHVAMQVHQHDVPSLLKSLTALEKMFAGEEGVGRLPEVNEVKTLEPILGKTFVRKAIDTIKKIKEKPKTRGQKLLGQLKEVMNFPRSVLASIDFSAVGRQGALMAFLKPKAWLSGVGAGYRAFFSEDYADFVDLSLKTHPLYNTLQKSGVFLSERGKLSESEEYFASRLAHSLPGIKASERAYVTSLNVMRAHAFYSIATDWAGTGKMSDLPELAKILNHLTGRGSLGSLKKLSPALNIMFFAPKLQIARVQTMTDLVPIRDGKFYWSPAQKILAADLASAFGTGMLVLWLLSHLKGVKVEDDPRSSDFGKVRIGDTRIDFWGGYTQMMRLVANIATGKVKSSTSGEVYDIPISQTIGRYLQTKLSPVAGAALDVYRGEDFKGDLLEPTPESVTKQIYQRFTPLFIQDMADSIYYQGLNTGTALTSGLALHGIGAMTYPVSGSTQAMASKNHYAMQTYGERWNDLGPISQKYLRVANPIIDEMDRRARKERVSKAAKARSLKELRKSERKLFRALKPEIRKELDRLLIPVGGLSRRLSEDWYLNDSRYQQYQAEVAVELNKLLPSFIDVDLVPEVKRAILEKAISQVKEGVRKEIVMNAKFEDLRRL